MSGDRLADEYEREAAEMYLQRQTQLKEFAEAVLFFAFDRLAIAANVRRFSNEDKLLIMQQYCDMNGCYDYDIWMATQREKDDFFWDALEHMHCVKPKFLADEDDPVDDPNTKDYRVKMNTFTEELKFYCLDFMPDERKFDEKDEQTKMAIMHRFNERVGLKNVGIWVQDEERFFENYLDFIRKNQ